ncbi:MAG: FAD-dependent oxidoreductase, partial [Pirellulaceae bacterium]|nr:FAD-dependent oxidoreductase [Pirellulaceae bacterium]
YMRKSFDAVCLCMGAGRPRPLEVPGAELDGVSMAMDFLTQQNRRVAGDPRDELGTPVLNAAGKHVVVLGGGDTGSDCVGTAIRQGALSVTQLEILPQPPEDSNPETPWPNWPKIMRTSSSQQEGCRRRWSVMTKSLSGSGGHLTELHACEVDWVRGDRGWAPKERHGTDFRIQADMVLLAMGFLHVDHAGLINPMGLELDGRGNVAARDYMTSIEGVFAAGDTIRGASLVVHAINEGRQAAATIDRWLRTMA